MAITLSMERPSRPTLRPFLRANSRIIDTRWMELAKVVMITRPSAWEMWRSRQGNTERSGGQKPGTSELVESLNRHNTPCSP